MTPHIYRVFQSRWELLEKDMGVPAPARCDYTTSIPAKNTNPPYVCQNEIEWAVLAPANYHHHKKEHLGSTVPLEKRDAWSFVCRECAVKLYGNVVFHEDKTFEFPDIYSDT
jgi:hypothetical protein